jgi:hypothetical protein
MNYTNYNYKKGSYTPKRAVKKFTDLDVYTQSHEISVFVCKELIASLEDLNKQGEYINIIKQTIIERMIKCALETPRLVAEAHSKRFGAGKEPLDILDIVMHKCNAMVAYLYQVHDILENRITTERFEEQITKCFVIRRKTLSLQRVWKKSIQTYEERNK